MKNIIGYKNYVINDDGEVYNKKTFNKLSIHKDKKGYCYVWLWENNIGKRHSIHRLVSIHFIDNKLNKPCVNHKDGIKSNNCVNNLEWVSASENIIHAYKNNLIKHSEKQVEWARKLGKTRNKYILCTQTGIFYESCTEASKLLINKYKSIQSAQASLSAMLLGKIINNTSFIYV